MLKLVARTIHYEGALIAELWPAPTRRCVPDGHRRRPILGGSNGCPSSILSRDAVLAPYASSQPSVIVPCSY